MTSGCAKRTPVQRDTATRFTDHVITDHPADWTELSTKYDPDPEGQYWTATGPRVP
ncbi:hypothetical protein [Streptomyces spectabilis]|uniref:hypothetical protein n=1 Tax=Streptomyces spectabilis TaxID=68270 RepID=UPI00298EFA69|nr:hypothetical protein [Streptomyces spectabilis]